MNVKFNRQVVIDNIMTLIQRSTLKVGEVESHLGVSTGYLSRLSKKENESAISAEFIWKVAQFFKVSVDCIIRSRIDEEDRMIDYMRKFINKIISQTNDGTLEWKAIHVEDINHMLMEETRMEFPVMRVRNGGFSKNPPCSADDPIRIDNALSTWGDNKVLSCVYGGVIVNPQGTIYHVNFPWTYEHSKELYLAYYCTEGLEGAEEFYELMLVDNGDLEDFMRVQDHEDYGHGIGKSEVPEFVNGVCNTFQTAWDPVRSEMQELYQTVSSHEKDIVLSCSVKTFIDSFMKEDELPF